MAKTLEQFTAEAMNAYQPAKSAIQTQLGSLDANRTTAVDNINRGYAQQQAQLEGQRNQAAESASMQAAGSGGSFGGSANIANRKYYERSFIPAQTQLQTNQANELAQANQNFENQRTSLNSQLANLEAQQNQQALQQYWAAEEQEKVRAAQAASEQAYYKYLADQVKKQQEQNGVKTWDFGNGYTLSDVGGKSVYSKNGNIISAGQFLEGTSRSGNARWDLWRDVWNNGVSTEGVGSDTIGVYERQKGMPSLKYLPNGHKYSYLY